MIKIVSANFSRYRTVIVWLLLCLLMLAYLSNSLQVRSDISFFLPKDGNDIDVILQQQLREGEAGKLILIALHPRDDAARKTISRHDLAQLNKTLTAQLQQSERFSQVQNGQMTVSSVVPEPFYHYRYLFNNDNQQRFSHDSLNNDFEQLLQRMSLMLTPMEQKLFAEDPQMFGLGLLKQWQTQTLPKHHGVWFDKQGQQSVLFVQTKAHAYDLQLQQKNLAIIERHIQHIIKNSPRNSDLDYTLTGAPIFALASKQAISKQIQVISTLASVSLIIFLYWVFRSVSIVLVIALPLAFAILTGMTTVMLTDGFIHGISIAFGITIIGVVVDYPVHIFSHKLSLIPKHKPIHDDSIITTVWPMIRLGLITTIIGFSAITLSDFSGLRQLGIFAISGLLAGALFCRFILPLWHLPLPESRSLSESGGFKYLFRLPQLRASPLLQALALILPLFALVFILFNQSHLWQQDFAALSPVPQWQKQKDFQLRQAMGLPELRYALIVQGHNSEAVLQQQEQLTPELASLKQQGIISGYDMAARYLPSMKQQQAQQQLLPSADDLQQRLETILQHSPLAVEAFQPFVDAVTDSRHMKPLSSQTLLTDPQFQQNVLVEKIRTLLYPPQENTLWTGIIPLQGVHHDINDHAIITQLADKARLLDLKTQTETLLANYRNNALLWFLLGTILILLVLSTASRQPRIMLPLVWPFTGAVLMTIATLLLMGYSLSVFHLVTLLLVVGLGIDYSIFSVLPRQQAREATQLSAVARVSVIICLISTLIMFGALALSELPVLKAIGLTASLGALYAFLLTRLVKQAT